ncbi:MAG TPA: protein kinase [Bacteroidota bacterium]|nr:protein kinase [Bacteroidota bacterium]
MIGSTISHYKILEKLGEGGMGIVYKAQDTRLDRIIALKFLPQHLSTSEQDKLRFVQEAKAAAALNHPNVCSIIDIQEHDAQMFIVMEFVDGQTLREKRGQIGFKQAIDIGIQVADGLAAAHEKGIVHRDIKPENIMVRKDGIAQIMDFGLAKLRNASSNANRLTKEGSTVGTAGYMSPEQITGSDVDHRSDIFSFGVMLFELVTGQLPFKGVHETALAYEIVNVDAPPISSIKPEVDPELDRIVLECLDKDPNERTQSAKQVSVDLKRFKRESSRQRMSRVTAARPALKVSATSEGLQTRQSSWKGNFGYVLSALLLAALIASIWVPWKKVENAPRPIVRSSISLPPDAPISGLGIAVSPDGKNLVYTSQSGQLYLHRMDQSTSQPIPGAIGIVPTFSPDGQWLAYNGYNKISKVSLTGSAPEDVCPLQSLAAGMWWTPDNKILFGTYSSGLAEVSAAGGIPTIVTSLDSSAGEISHRFPQLLPDGKSVIYTAKTKDMASFDEALVVAQRLSTGERKVIVKGGYFGRYIPSGHLLYLRGSTIFAVHFDPERLEVSGAAVPIEQGGALNDGTMILGVSNNGVAAFAPPSAFKGFNNRSIGWFDRAGTLHPLFDTLRNYSNAALSPDGQKIALEIGSANDDIWMYDISRGLLSRLTFGWGNNNYPVWSANGKYVIYSAEKGQIANIYKKAWDGSGNEDRLTSSLNPQRPVTVTRDGKYLSFEENNDIWILPLDSEGTAGKPFPYIQTPADESGGFFSPDGKWMAYMSDESGKDEVYVVAFPKREGKRQVSNGGGAGGAFSRDGRELFYGNGRSFMVVDVKQGTTTEFSVPRKLFTIPQEVSLHDISLDGSQFLSLVHRAKPDSIQRLDVVTEWFEVVKSKFARN